VTLVVQGGVPEPVSYDGPALRALVLSGEQSGGLSRRDAIAQVARSTGVPKREVYDAVHRA
jgi:16S rRNA (cytidine1402-2'-O)-methyltransferase